MRKDSYRVWSLLVDERHILRALPARRFSPLLVIAPSQRLEKAFSYVPIRRFTRKTLGFPGNPGRSEVERAGEDITLYPVTEVCTERAAERE